MEKLIESDVKKAYTEKYAKLLKDFCNDEKICQIAKNYPFNGHNCVPAPFLPIIGSGYYKAPIRVAIYGMETLCWHDLSKFVQKYHDSYSTGKNPLVVIKRYTDGNEDGTEIKGHGNHQRFHVHHGVNYWEKRKNAFGFWTFAFSVLADIYNKTEKQVRGDQKILSSFIWGNVNAYEKYEATWKKLKVASNRKQEDWRTVFERSKCFNSAQLLLPYARPQIMLVFYKEMSLKWLIKKNDETQDAKVEVREIQWDGFESKYIGIIKDSIRYYYLPETRTCVLHTLHPGRMRYYKGMSADIWKAAIKHALQQIIQNNNISSSD